MSLDPTFIITGAKRHKGTFLPHVQEEIVDGTA
jgi:hypothetical protein